MRDIKVRRLAGSAMVSN